MSSLHTPRSFLTSRGLSLGVDQNPHHKNGSDRPLSKSLRRFRRRLNQSKALRTGGVSHPDAAALKVGDFVRLRGTVSAGARVLESPMKGVSCVSYRVNVVRVVDSRTAKKKVSMYIDYGLAAYMTPACVGALVWTGGGGYLSVLDDKATFDLCGAPSITPCNRQPHCNGRRPCLQAKKYPFVPKKMREEYAKNQKKRRQRGPANRHKTRRPLPGSDPVFGKSEIDRLDGAHRFHWIREAEKSARLSNTRLEKRCSPIKVKGALVKSFYTPPPPPCEKAGWHTVPAS